MDLLTFLLDLLKDESIHFWLAFISGSLGSFSILIILYALRLVTEHLTRRKMPVVVVYGMVFISLVLGYSLTFFSHVLLDGYAIWYTKPLGPSLNLY